MPHGINRSSNQQNTERRWFLLPGHLLPASQAADGEHSEREINPRISLTEWRRQTAVWALLPSLALRDCTRKTGKMTFILLSNNPKKGGHQCAALRPSLDLEIFRKWKDEIARPVGEYMMRHPDVVSVHEENLALTMDDNKALLEASARKDGWTALRASAAAIWTSQKQAFKNVNIEWLGPEAKIWQWLFSLLRTPLKRRCALWKDYSFVELYSGRNYFLFQCANPSRYSWQISCVRVVALSVKMHYSSNVHEYRHGINATEAHQRVRIAARTEAIAAIAITNRLQTRDIQISHVLKNSKSPLEAARNSTINLRLSVAASRKQFWRFFIDCCSNLPHFYGNFSSVSQKLLKAIRPNV